SEQAAERLAKEIVPYARALLDEHRKAGRPVVMATTTPYDMVAPLAARLEIDDVVATRYAVRDDVYTGGLEGPFVWGRGKLEPFDLLRPFLNPLAYPYARFDIDGTDRIPRKGPVIVVANHRSYFDVATMAVTVGHAGRPIRFLGKAEVFDAPVIGPLARALGGIRVERGTGSDEPLREAAEALEGGQLVALMPQGTIPRGEAFFDPVLKGKWGAARLAAM